MARGPFAGTQALRVASPLSNIVNSSTFVWFVINASQSANNRIWQYGNNVGLGFQNAGLLLQVVDEGIAWRGSGVTLATGVWIPVCVLNSAGSYFVYVNGVLSHSAAGSAGAISGNFSLGNSNDGTHSANAYFGPGAVWNSVLTANQIAAISAGSSPLLYNPSTLQAAWGMWGQFSAGGGEIDLSPHKRDLSPVGNPGVLDGQPRTASYYGPF